MAPSIISSGLEKLQSAVSAAGENAKVASMAKDTQDVHAKSARITTDYGVKQSNTDDWLKVVTDDHTGPTLLEDQASREKINRFDHERIPERVIHARGVGAFGTFKLHKSLAEFSKAGVLNDTSRTTPVFLRFSTVLGSRGSADTVRDVRGFAVKFYTEEGNWDIVGNNIPVFFIQDALKFPDLIHAGKPEPHNEVPQAQSAHNNFWDFMYLHSEANHMVMWQQSDRAIPRSYRMVQGFGVNTYTLDNAQGERFFVKFHFTPQLGVHSLVWDEALKLAGQDPDFLRKDLAEAIDNGVFPKWDFGVQVLPESREHEFDFDILDATKIWPVEDVPIQNVGELELNRNVDEYFTQTEQVAFCTGHVVPGIGFSDDPLLHGRNFSYQDTQLSRLGTNWQELPINRAVCPVMNHNRDGQGRHTITKGTVNYWPNRFSAVPPAKPEEGGYVEYPQEVKGIKKRMRSKKFLDHISQAQLFYNSLAPPEKAHLEAALSFELDHCDDPIVYERYVQRLMSIDPQLARNVADAVGAPLREVVEHTNHGKRSAFLSQTEVQPATPTVESRRVAILIADGYDAVAYNAVVASLKAARAFPFTISTKRNPIFAAGESASSSSAVRPDHNLEGQRSTMYDAVFIPGGAESVAILRGNGRALHWVREAFAHCKTLGATGEAVEFVKDACAIGEDLQFSTSAEPINSYGIVTLSKAAPDSLRESVDVIKGATDFLDNFLHAISLHRHFDRELKGFTSQVAY